jgi:transcriptional regulator with XRE-family HTH domain
MSKPLKSGERAAKASTASTVAEYEREMRGLTVDEVSAATRIDAKRLTDLERGKPSYISLHESIALERVLGASESDLRKPMTDELRGEKLI